ncbi:PTS glucose transporter subunit IIA [Actinotalea sp. C106]|uniref:PTS sugar transporter subunit IIA n=1 Tax=Actinotalea sp. C106 TaxID=2908644 RepID=UPI00202925ED|nr:PTS glucose transporter subunit IIA [Actinotalea sp. C106]
MARTLTVLAPVAGTVLDLAEVPDPVFAQAMVGPGAAIRPTTGVQAAVAPVDGIVSALQPHAFVVTSGMHGVLVHLGIETVSLAGEGYTTLARRGASVTAGAPVVRWRPDEVIARGLSALCPVIAVQADPAAVELLAPAGTVVAGGTPLLRWSPEGR